MAWIHIGMCLVIAVGTAVAQMHCPQGDRFPWIPEGGIILDFETGGGCCDLDDPMSPFDPQGACALCYYLTKSTPGFAADPNNCQKFYMCEPAGGTDKWNVFPMTCPNCTFWDQDKLTCVEVYNDPDDRGVCGDFPVYTGRPPTAPQPFDEERKMFCIHFDDKDLIADNGIYVYNEGVELVQDNSVCPKPDSQCGHFLGYASRLGVPFFAHNYDSFKALVITFYYRRTGAGTNVQGILSNDCFPNGSGVGALGNSLYCSVNGSKVNAGLKEPPANVQGDDLNHSVVFAKIKWEFGQLSIELRQNDKFGPVLSPPNPISFKGPIRNSVCSLVIGSFIKEAATSFFEGYMDDICFYKWDE